ncbi:hypothetical protein [Conexibacter woesei]|uniref:hypothetical protein n=1 Tax=Conexibacter woesei TaxID=191495 RepID=UPI000420639D|nr:hypothetical protein [Conexibacter woesei]
MSLEVVAILLTLLVHILGAAVLVKVLLDGEQIDWRGTLFPRDDDGGPPKWDPPEPEPDPSGGSLPLPESSPSRFRLRRKGTPSYPKPPRRPAHTPERTPDREPASH